MRVVEVDIPSDVRFIENVVEMVLRECEVWTSRTAKSCSMFPSP